MNLMCKNSYGFIQQKKEENFKKKIIRDNEIYGN